MRKGLALGQHFPSQNVQQVDLNLVATRIEMTQHHIDFVSPLCLGYLLCVHGWGYQSLGIEKQF